MPQRCGRPLRLRSSGRSGVLDRFLTATIETPNSELLATTYPTAMATTPSVRTARPVVLSQSNRLISIAWTSFSATPAVSHA